jgi:hypothetical protein
MNLSEWVKQHRDGLRQEAPAAEVIVNLRAVAEREIADAESVLSDDGRLEHAHAACLALANAALAACGYRVRSGASGHHFLTLDSLQYTLNLSEERVGELQEFRRKRSRSMYEQVGVVTNTEAGAALAAARQLSDEFERWLEKWQLEQAGEDK